MMTPRNVILWGGTGQAKVVRPIIENGGAKVVATFDDTPDMEPPFPDVAHFCGREGYQKWISGRDLTSIGFCVTIGNPHGEVRCRIHDFLCGEGLVPVSVIHPSAIIAMSSVLDSGVQVLAGAIVSEQVVVGRQCIINTKASVDHECTLGEGVEISPGATLCGLVTAADYVWVGAGATVLPRVKLGENAIVGAGAVIRGDVPSRTTIVGVPGRIIQKKSIEESC